MRSNSAPGSESALHAGPAHARLPLPPPGESLIVRLVLRSCAALLCITLAFAQASAEESADRFTVSVIERMPDLEAARFVLSEAYRRIGIDATFRHYEAGAALEASRSGETDAELCRIGGIDRDFPELVQVPIPVNLIHGVAFARGLRFPIRNWNSLVPYRVGIVRGILFATEGTRGMDVQMADDHHELTRWLAEGKVEVGVMSRSSGEAAIRAGNHSDVHELEGQLETVLLYHYVNAEHAEIATRLEPVLKEMLLDGTTRRLLGQSMPSPEADAP